MSWYRAGIITLTNGSKNVTGTGTAWLANVVASSGLKTPTGIEEIESISANGALQLVEPYAGPTAAGISYAIIPTQGLVPTLAKGVSGLLATIGEMKDAYEGGDLVGMVDLEKRATLTQLAATGGSALMGYDGGTLQDVADYAKPLQDFTALRAYTGRAKAVRITATGIAGIFERDLVDTTSADNGGTILVDASGRRWKRQTQGLIATPLWFGLPLVSAGVNYAAALQVVISHPQFSFPKGFRCSSTTLFAKSNTRGDWGDAFITLMPGSPNYTPVVSFEGNPTNVCYFGGKFHGNRGTESNTGPGGQDGGLHGCRVYSGTNIHWYGPTFLNCATDGLYISETDGTIDGVNFYEVEGNNCSRQGLSVINVTLVNFHGSKWLNTNGKLPQAGIDIEPNLPTESIKVNFFGKTLCQGNTGRGFMIHGSGSLAAVYTIHFDDITCLDNGAPESFRLTNGGTQRVTADLMYCDKAVSFATFGNINFKAKRIICNTFGIGNDATTSTGEMVLMVDYLDTGNFGYASTSSVDTAFSIGGQVAARREVTIGKVVARNAGGNVNNSYSGYVMGSANLSLKIGEYRSVSPRGLNLNGPGGWSKINVIVDRAMQSDAVSLKAGSYGWVVDVLKTVADGQMAAQVAGNENEVIVRWSDANAALIAAGGTANRLTAIGYRGTALLMTIGGSGQIVQNCFLNRSDGGTLLYKEGAGHIFIGNVPTNLGA